MGMAHDVEDGRDAAARARSTNGTRRRPIRYDHDTWLVMRTDPVLPAAVILRLRNPDGRNFFVAVSWDLDPDERRMVGRFANLEEADGAVLYSHPNPVVADPRDDLASFEKRQEKQAIELERQRIERAKLYGP